MTQNHIKITGLVLIDFEDIFEKLHFFFEKMKNFKFSYNFIRNNFFFHLTFTEREAFPRIVATSNAGLAIAF